ncbi:O-acetylserine/cysteine efflux transporter [Bradyrhizobium sp. USDA 4461]
MKPLHIILGILVAAAWGFNFVIIRWGLDSFPPLFLASTRFALAATPIVFFPRPPISLASFIALGATWFFGQFAFLFVGMSLGMPPGLASIVMQTQAFLTVLFAGILLGETVRAKQAVSLAVAAVGLAIIAGTVVTGTGDVTLIGFVLVLLASLNWAIGNILVKKVRAPDMLALVCWLCIVPPLPLLACSLWFEGWSAIAGSIHNVSLRGVGVVVYLGLISTIFAYGLFGFLIGLYSASAVAPFAFLVPVFGTFFAWAIFGETFSSWRLTGILLVLLALAILLLPRIDLAIVRPRREQRGER